MDDAIETLVINYVEGLKNAYTKNHGKKAWKHFEEIKQGADKEQLQQVMKEYPQTPQSLLKLLEYVDGTYWREYADAD